MTSDEEVHNFTTSDEEVIVHNLTTSDEEV